MIRLTAAKVIMILAAVVFIRDSVKVENKLD
jgi:hypothetical protein